MSFLEVVSSIRCPETGSIVSSERPPSRISSASSISSRISSVVEGMTRPVREKISSVFSLARKISHESRMTEELRQSMERARIAKLQEALEIGLTGNERGKRESRDTIRAIDSEAKRLQCSGILYQRIVALQGSAPVHRIDWRQCDPFVQRIFAVRERIQKGDGVDEIREELSDLVQDPIYELLKDEDLAPINFLQILCIKLHRADGNEVLRSYADKRGLVWDERHSLKSLAKSMSAYLETSYAHKKDGLIQTLFWAIFHPGKVLHSLCAKWWPLRYNSHQGNPSFAGHTFCSEDGKKIQFVWGPGLTGDAIAEKGLLPAYKKFQMRELRFDYQDIDAQGERQRVDAVQRISSQSKGTLSHVVLGFDAKAKYEGFRSVNSIDLFLIQYRRLLKDGFETSGVKIPPNLLSHEEIERILMVARTLFFEMHIWDELGNEKQRPLAVKTMLLILDAMLSSVILYKQLRQTSLNPDIDSDLQTDVVTAACKQGIDRGVVQANALRLFFRAFFSDAELTANEMKEIYGSMLGRARMVEGREILQERYQVFHHFLEKISGREKFLHEQMQRLTVPLVPHRRDPKETPSKNRGLLDSCEGLYPEMARHRKILLRVLHPVSEQKKEQERRKEVQVRKAGRSLASEWSPIEHFASSIRVQNNNS